MLPSFFHNEMEMQERIRNYKPYLSTVNDADLLLDFQQAN